MERICVYPGSFDPITTGHMDMIRRACRLFDRVIVAVLHNPHKTGAIPVEQRVALIKRCCGELPQVTVDRFEGLTMSYAEQAGACAVIRGLRSAADFDSEQVLAQINQRICPQVESVFIMCEPSLAIVSSSAVREMAAFGSDFCGFVPQEIERDVRALLTNH